MSMTTQYYRVCGLVQGVNYRQSTVQKAHELGVDGWVRNCSNGDVEGMVTATPEQLQNFSAWLKEGPELADVADVQLKKVAFEEFEGFEVYFD